MLMNHILAYILPDVFEYFKCKRKLATPKIVIIFEQKAEISNKANLFMRTILI